MYCSSCGVSVPADERYCSACGATLNAEPLGVRRVGQYLLNHEIARGGMGIVYDAYDERLERRVALKVLLGEFAEDRDFRSRFVQESLAAAALDHPNILPVFDAGEQDGILYIATRLVDGVDLSQQLARSRTLTVQRALVIVGQIAAALDYSHNRRIVHRDVKPANILLVADDGDEIDHAYLIDFGITTTQSRDMRLTATGQFVGTPEYVSPEQISGTPVDGRADQYALACVLFHCLTGSSPFARQTTIDVLHAHLHEHPPQPGAVVAAPIPGTVDAAIMRALSKDPQRRFESCRAFVAAARVPTEELAVPRTVFEQRRPITAPEATPAKPRVPAVFGIAALALLVALTGGLAAALLANRDDPKPARNVASAPTVATTPPPTTTVVTQITVTQPPTTTAAPPPRPASPPAAPPGRRLIALDASSLRMRHARLKGYSIDVPVSWTFDGRNRPQPTPHGVTRRRTVVADHGLGASVLIDALTGFHKTPAANRSYLDRFYRTDKLHYRRVRLDDYDVSGSHAYELGYRFESRSGREARGVDVFFKRGSRFFAVLASGYASYDALSALARRTSESVRVTPPPQKAEPQLTPLPDDGTYSGIGYQRSARGKALDDYSVRITFDDGDVTVNYPDLSCGGSLVADGRNGAQRIYRELLDHGTCSHGGHWTMKTLSSHEIRATWSKRSEGYTVRAFLTR